MDNHVPVSIINGRIWNIETAILELYKKLKEHSQVILDLQAEAPDLKETILYPVLVELSNQGIQHNQISILTGNLLESFDLFEVQRQPHFMYELKLFQEFAPNLKVNKQIQKHFGCLIGRGNLPRLILSSYLHSNHKDKTLQTFHYNSTDNYHKNHLGLEELMFHYGINSFEYREALSLIDCGPITIDQIETYPIIHPTNYVGPCNWYDNFFVDVVCETFYSGETFFVTEKFWRAVATRTPFIIQGPSYILAGLRKIGFKTFSQWWDEGYDEDPYNHKLLEIKKTIDFIASKSIEELGQMYQDMQSVLDHNYNLMMSLTYNDLKKVQR